MGKSGRLFKSVSRLVFPVIFLIVVAVVAGSVWLIHNASRPQTSVYILTPAKAGMLSTRAAQVTDETWPNRDGSTARGWLLRGADGAPGVLLLHKYGADRSHLLNLGVKLNESTNFTVLMPDLRAHGENPAVVNASFGGCETEDAAAAIEFLRGLKTSNQISLVGKDLGIYGVEMGSLVALASAANDEGIKAIALDSMPSTSDAVLDETVSRRFPFADFATTRLAQLGTYMYYFDGCYQRRAACEMARRIGNRNIMLLAGVDAPAFQGATSDLAKCFPALNKIESKTDLSPSGLSIINASMEQTEAYDQRLIDFFRNSLTDYGNTVTVTAKNAD